ncbi:MAG: hypothetical protein KGD59_15015 [Candidatus Heimdallarchaeota archaeon]|nr:hypothetical protein [Candidatus Heimdallarchaeota archaeon]MBY8995859.1 hypothetical protein [Candidatus Heimdallarchaeota archaeon]
MVPRRSDRELIEHMLTYLNDIKTVATEGELAAALKINSETANKWIEIFQLIKKNCPEFQYKKIGRYRLIDKVGLGGLAQEISEVELKHVAVTRYRVTRFNVLNAIHSDIRKLTKMLIWGPRSNDMSDWNTTVKSSNKVLLKIIKHNLNQLAGPEGKDDAYQAFKSSLQTSLDDLMKSIKDLMTGDVSKPILKLITLERNFILKLVFITREFEEAELKAGKKPDLHVVDEKEIPKGSRKNMLAEMKVTLDNLPDTLKKPDKSEIARIGKRAKFDPFLRCFTCNFEQEFPIHCTQHMDYEDGQLVCEICKERLPIPKCTKCKQKLGIDVKEL